jgi:hypothetical protein
MVPMRKTTPCINEDSNNPAMNIEIINEPKGINEKIKSSVSE